MLFKKIAILGAGSWGMAIARLLDINGAEVKLWEYNQKDYNIIKTKRNHPDKLPQINLSESIDLTNNLNYAVADAELVVLAIPSQFVRKAISNLNIDNCNNKIYINLAKGIETDSLRRMSEVISETLKVNINQVTTMSGPSHAEEVAADMPTAVVIAGYDNSLLEKIQTTFSNQTFRVYQSEDLIGVELGGSLKNIIAIAAGITTGLEMGDNTLGALITRGLAEISRLGLAMGAQASTFAGLSGIGDLITTCASQHSRNRYVGVHIGKGEKLSDILNNMSMVAEGVETTRSGYTLSEKYQVEMPITTEVHKVLFEGKDPAEALGDLMGRKLKSEIWQ